MGHQIASLKLGKIDFSICTSAMMPVALYSPFFLDRKRPPAGRQGRPKRPIINCAPIIFLPLLLTVKVADNQIFQYVYPQIHQIHTSIDLGSRFSIGSC
jgi:hypothetical protein